MIKFLGITIGSGLIGIFILFKLFGGNDGPAYVPAEIKFAPKQVNTSVVDAKHEKAQRIRNEVAKRFDGAPDYIIDLAAKIANDDILLISYTDEILSLSADQVNQGYGQPFPSSAPEYKHTLLREAVIDGNTGAAALLLDRGGDVHYNDDEMAFQAINLEEQDTKYDLWFPNYSSGSKFLRMWLDKGGDPNITHPLYGKGIGTLINHAPKNNLEGTLSLLAYGADPWSPFEITTDDGEYLYERPGYFASLVTGSRRDAEMAFRIAREGYYRDGPEEDAIKLRDAIELTSAHYIEQSGQNSQNTLWALNKAFTEIFASLDVPPGKQTKRIIEMSFPNSVGGFFLAEGEIHSSPTADQRVYDQENQIGREKWEED